MSVRGWEFKVLEYDHDTGTWFAYGTSCGVEGCQAGVVGETRKSKAEAQSDLADLERRVLAFELAGRGVDVKEMAKYLEDLFGTMDVGALSHADFWKVKKMLATFKAALAEVEGKEEE